MLFLFLDCETTGLTKNDQIIEIGAILVYLDEQNWQMTKLREFETLIKINTEIEDKISRITGIDNNILSKASKLEIAQKMWESWLKSEIKNWQNNFNLQKNESNLAGNGLQNNKLENSENSQKDCQIAIIGHSLDFDLGFLERENWFLPENFIRIDTLDLSKIFLPFVEAVNLEFLTKKINLTTQNSNLNNLENNLESNMNKFHRAKFDAECSWKLLEYLLDLFVFCYILDVGKVYFTKQFLKNLEEFLPLNLINIKEIVQSKLPTTNKNQDLSLQKANILKNKQILETQSEVQNKSQNQSKNPEKIINLEGLEVLSFSQKLANWSKIEPNKLQKILYQKLPKNLNLLTLQLFLIAFINQNWHKLQIKLDDYSHLNLYFNSHLSQNYSEIFQNQNLEINAKNNVKKSANTNFVPNLKLHTQKDLFLVAELFLEN